MRRFIVVTLLFAALATGAYLLRDYHDRLQSDPDILILFGNVDVRQVDLGFRVDGRIATMPFQEGEFILAGTFMGDLDKAPYEDQKKEAAARVEAALASLINAQLVLKRREQLKGTLAVSWEDYENALLSKDVAAGNLQAAEAALALANTNIRDADLFAPSDGYVLTRIREPGAIVRQADPIYTLSLTDPIWVRAFITEPHLGQIYFGMPAEVHTDAHKIYHGHVGFISPVSEFTPKTVETTQLRTDLVYRLRIIVDNPDRYLRQGMPVTVKLHLNQQQK